MTRRATSGPVDGRESASTASLDVLGPGARLHRPVGQRARVGAEVALDVGVPAAFGEVRHRADEREVLVPGRVDMAEALRATAGSAP